MHAPIESIRPKTTRLLQPLDTHAFEPFKQYLEIQSSEIQVKEAKSRLSNFDWVSLSVDLIRKVIQGANSCHVCEKKHKPGERRVGAFQGAGGRGVRAS